VIARPCIRCGDVIPTGTHCTDCQPKDTRRSRQRGYTTSWDRLSKRARRLQPFCSDCGATEELECDHTPEAWRRHNAGKTIRLQDIDVVCGPCNRRRGQARPTPVDPNEPRQDPDGKAQGALHTPRGIAC
jgi:5-methylcytosine-specific restriction protein A